MAVVNRKIVTREMAEASYPVCIDSNLVDMTMGQPYHSFVHQDVEYCLEPLLFGRCHLAIYDLRQDLLAPKENYDAARGLKAFQALAEFYSARVETKFI